MPQYRVIVEELVEGKEDIERLRVIVDATGPLDHAAVLAAVQKTKRVYTKRAPKVQP